MFFFSLSIIANAAAIFSSALCYCTAVVVHVFHFKYSFCKDSVLYIKYA